MFMPRVQNAGRNQNIYDISVPFEDGIVQNIWSELKISKFYSGTQ
jgi:hypothetical protein